MQVPVGISVSISNPGEPVRPIGDLNTPNQRLLVAQGGFGGTPVTNYIGTPGESRSIVLDLKVRILSSLLSNLSFITFSYWPM